MKTGAKVYYLDNEAVKTGVIVSKEWRFDPFPRAVYIVREVKDLATLGLAGTLAAAINGSVSSLTLHSSNTLFKYVEQPAAAPVQPETAEESA